MTDQKELYASLMASAVAAREYSYSPYSGYRVGAALLGADGRIYTGCNIENAGYSPTNCAERTAVFKAVSEGEREFIAIAIVGGKGEETASFCAPCGVCRQVLAEFCDSDFAVVLGNPEHYEVFSFAQLLPFSFGKADLK